MSADLLVQNGLVILPGIGTRELNIAVKGGRVVALLEKNETIKAQRILEAKGKLVFPGGIDGHTHLTMGPGLEGYASETRSAALGGITSTLSYLLESGDLGEVLQKEIEYGEAKASCDFGLHPSVVTDAQLKDLPRIVAQFGVPSFKFFMIFRGEEGAYLGIPGNDDGFLFKLFRQAAALPGVIPCVHAENIELVWLLRPEVQAGGNGGLRDWERSRPDFVEAEATARALYYAQKAGSPLYVVHITCAESLEVVRQAKKKRPGWVFAETCPHYLTLTSENAPDPEGKVNPPLRYSKDIESLWEGVADNTIDVIGSDHVPRQAASKKGGIWKASAGFPGLATMVPIFLTEGTRRSYPLEQLLAKVTGNPANIFGLSPVKGFLWPGSDADLVVVDPDHEFSIRAQALSSHADYTPYEGRSVKFRPIYTILRGQVMVEEGIFTGVPGSGTYLKRYPNVGLWPQPNPKLVG
jgi:dihydroorotase (multifunctional complex type)